MNGGSHVRGGNAYITLCLDIIDLCDNSHLFLCVFSSVWGMGSLIKKEVIKQISHCTTLCQVNIKLEMA